MAGSVTGGPALVHKALNVKLARRCIDRHCMVKKKKITLVHTSEAKKIYLVNL